MSSSTFNSRKRAREDDADTNTNTSINTSSSTPPSTISVPVPVVQIPSTSPFRETAHAFVNIHLPHVLSNIIIELLEDQWNEWIPIDGVSCDLFLPFSTDSSENATSHHCHEYDVFLSSVISLDVSHIRYHLAPHKFKLDKYCLTETYRSWAAGYQSYTCKKNEYRFRWIDWCGNISWNHMHMRKHTAAAAAPTPTPTLTPNSNEQYEIQHDRIIDEMSDVERSIVNHLFASSPYSWSQFRKSLPTTATLAHILSRPWSAWRVVDTGVPISNTYIPRFVHHLELISPQEWIKISCLNDCATAGEHGIRLEYQPHDTSPSPHPIMEGMTNPVERFQLCVRLM